MIETFEETREKILTELTSDDADVRAEFVKIFETDTKVFCEAMADAIIKWRSLDADSQGNEKRAYISAMVFTAISLHILSLKLFLSGQAVASGSLFRQVVESIALALVCSGKDLGMLERFMENEYSTNVAVRDVLRHSERLGLKDDGVQALRDAQKFYDNYSHITILTIAAGMSFSEKSGLYVGAAFDEGKVEAYRKEARGRVSLAEVFPNFVEGVIANIAKW